MHGEKSTCYNADISGKCPAVLSGVNISIFIKYTASNERAICMYKCFECKYMTQTNIFGSACYNYVITSTLFRLSFRMSCQGPFL